MSEIMERLEFLGTSQSPRDLAMFRKKNDRLNRGLSRKEWDKYQREVEIEGRKLVNELKKKGLLKNDKRKF